jgi:hypothetical protein
MLSGSGMTLVHSPRLIDHLSQFAEAKAQFFAQGRR